MGTQTMGVLDELEARAGASDQDREQWLDEIKTKGKRIPKGSAELASTGYEWQMEDRTLTYEEAVARRDALREAAGRARAEYNRAAEALDDAQRSVDRLNPNRIIRNDFPLCG